MVVPTAEMQIMAISRLRRRRTAFRVATAVNTHPPLHARDQARRDVRAGFEMGQIGKRRRANRS
jgi:hypothetical protein